MKLLNTALIGAALIAATGPALAVSWVKILKDTPAEVFEEEDLEMFFAQARQTLNAEGPPQTVRWNNPATGAGGTFLVVGEMKSKSGAPCKKLHLSIYAKSRAEKGVTAAVCQTPDKRWQLGAPK